jgi:hypothetical protein
MKQNLYSKRFRTILEQEELQPAEFDAAGDAEALAGSMEGEVQPSDMGATPTDQTNPRAKYMARIEDIIDKFEEFAKYLNSEEHDSVNQFLNAVDKDGSIFSGMSRETGKVTTVAESLAALAESFRGYMLTGQRKLRDQEAALAEF